MKRSRSFQLLRIVCHYEINRRSTKMVDRTENMIELLKWLEWNIFRTRSHREPWDRGTDRCVRFLSHTGKNIVEATRTANSNNIPITNNNNKQQQQYRHVHICHTQRDTIQLFTQEIETEKFWQYRRYRLWRSIIQLFLFSFLPVKQPLVYRLR